MRAKSVNDKENEISSTAVCQKTQISTDNNMGRPIGEKEISTHGPNAKRKPCPRKPISQRRVTFENNESNSTIVVTNRELSTALINLKKKVLQNQTDYEKLLALLFAEKKEKWFLQSKLAQRDDQIKNLEQQIKVMNESRFCKDLIQLNESTTTTIEGSS